MWSLTFLEGLWPFTREVKVGSFRVRVGKQIGEGAFSYVYVAHDVRTREKFALKKMIVQENRQFDVLPRNLLLRRCLRGLSSVACTGGAMGDGRFASTNSQSP